MSARNKSLLAGYVMIVTAGHVFSAQNPSAADVLQANGYRLRDPAVRRQAAAGIAEAAAVRRASAEARARSMGLPLRGARPDGGAFELIDFRGSVPLYLTTLNANAGISTGANLLRQAPYHVDGSGGVVGVWDASSARTTHQEFGGRVTSKDGAGVTYDHSTHVVGTVCAAGVDPAAIGMATGVRVDSYDWNDDASEVAMRGASIPCESGKINLSNHSYGIESGWVYTGLTSPVWLWYGTGTNTLGVEEAFGQYNSFTRDTDALAYSMPYHLMSWAAGNDRNNNPATGASVGLSSSGDPLVSYDSSLYPPGDGIYKSGYDTISAMALAKNVLTVGAVTDAVSGGLRSVGSASITSFSSWGPADDGRIKPDVVANGNSLKSSSYTGDADYSYMSGTSMASPNAVGTAQLLVHWFGVLFTNQAMRASTLKALLIHTADDKGTAGPDYQYGWGLVNGPAAADLLAAYRTNAGSRRVVEDLLATNRTSVDVAFAWDGASPIKATLCWTDPPGPAVSTHDSRVSTLVNNLDLRLVAPGGTVYQPWVMPFVGDWSVAACSAAAITGSNLTDNVEQVLIAAPPVSGVYTARVTYAGSLTNGRQPFSLLISGSASGAAVPAPVVNAVSPMSGAGAVPATLTGDGLMLGAQVVLRRGNRPQRRGVNVEVLGDSANLRVLTTGLEAGWWHLTVTNPDGQGDWLWNAIHVPRQFLAEDCETNDIAAKGWTSLALIGTSQWAVTNALSLSPSRALFSPGAATRSDTCVVSPAVAVSADATNLVLSFWQDYAFTVNDGGVCEVAVDGGVWGDVTLLSSAVENGYTGTVDGVGPPATLNPLKGREAWVGSSGGFLRTTLALDAAQTAGHTLQFRWRLGTNSGTASTGWYLDDVVLYDATVTPPEPFPGTVFEVR